MTQINQLAAYDNPTSGDQLVVFSTSNGDARRTSLNNFMIWLSTAFQSLTVAQFVRVAPVLVSNLPSASVAGAGARAMVSDANSTTFNSVVAGGGVNIVPVFSTGSAWRIG